MKYLAATVILLSPATCLAAEFKLEGYDREVNDGTVIREAKGVDDIVAVRFHCCRVSDSSLEHVARWPRLRGVYVRDMAITGVGFSHLKRHSRLKQATLSGPNVNDDGIEVLSQLPHVTHLSVGNGYRWDGLMYEPLITDTALKSIGRMNTVQYLSIDNAGITDAGLIHLAKLRDVRNIQFFRCKELTADGLDRLRKLLPKTSISAHVPGIGNRLADGT